MLELQQPSQLNRMLFPEYPGTWRDRRSAFAPIFPIILIPLMAVWEGMFLTAWVEGADFRERIPMLLAGTIFVPVFLFGATQLSVLFEIRSKRTLRFGKKRIRIVPGKPQFLKWKDVVGWQIEPIGTDNTLRKLSIHYQFTFRRSMPRRSWSVILNGTQVEQLRTTVRELQESGRCAAELVELNAPVAAHPRKRIPVSGMWFFAIGYGLLIQGIPYLLIGVFGGRGGGHGDHAVSDSFKEFVLANFSSVAELRAFCIVAGALLCLGGALSYVKALRVGKAATHDDTETEYSRI